MEAAVEEVHQLAQGDLQALSPWTESHSVKVTEREGDREIGRKTVITMAWTTIQYIGLYMP